MGANDLGAGRLIYPENFLERTPPAIYSAILANISSVVASTKSYICVPRTHIIGKKALLDLLPQNVAEWNRPAVFAMLQQHGRSDHSEVTLTQATMKVSPRLRTLP